jgi:predicted ATPase
VEFKINNVHNFNNFSFSDDNITLFAGINGSGKTTLLKIIGFCYECRYISNSEIILEKIKFIKQNIIFDDNNIKEDLQELEYDIVNDFDYEMVKKKFNDILKYIEEYVEGDKNSFFIRKMDFGSAKMLSLDEELDKYFSMKARLFRNELDCYDEQVEFSCSSESGFILEFNDESMVVKNREYVDVISQRRVFKCGNIFDAMGKMRMRNTKHFHEVEGENMDNYSKFINLKLSEKINKILNEEYDVAGNGFYNRKLNRNIKMNNVATGVFIFKYIYELFSIYNISSGSIVLLDEPDSYLHTQWQLKLSKLLSFIANEFGIKFIITTHSALFAESIGKHQSIKMYLLQKVDDHSIIKEVDKNDDTNEMLMEFANAYFNF